MPVKDIVLQSKIHPYTAHFAATADFLGQLNVLPNSIFIIDQNVWALHQDGILKELNRENVILLPIHEEKKTLDMVQELFDQMMLRHSKRNLNVISIGGGITQDLTGFMTSTLYRGVHWTFIPTTLLAQADSCIGSKTSLNYKSYKNLIGTFYPPNEIYIYTPFLKTLTTADYFSGIGEMAKVHIMGGRNQVKRFIVEFGDIADMNEDILLNAIQRSLSIKLSFMKGDEFDTGRRNMLNYGHCFGHAIEYATDYGIPHGQAVVIGMILANAVARNRGILSKNTEQYLLKNILEPVLKIDFKSNPLDNRKIIDGLKQDKKRTGSKLVLVMVNEDYEMLKVTDLDESEADEALREFKVLCIPN